MCKDLDEYLKKHKGSSEFVPGARYNRDGDMIEVYWGGEKCFGQEISGGLTLMWAQNNNRVVGVKIHNAKRLGLVPTKKETNR